MSNSKDNTVNVALISDANFLDFVMITMTSLLLNLPEQQKLTLHFLYPEGGISANDLKQFDKLQKFHPFTLNPISLDVEKFKKDYGKSKPCLWRLALPDLLPEVERLIYIDCDLVVLDDISKLYNQDLGDCPLGGIGERGGTSRPEISFIPENYINGGVMLWDLTAMRKENIPEIWRKTYLEHPTWFATLHDQDLVNYTSKGRIKLLPLNWNILRADFRRMPVKGMYTVEDVMDALRNPGIAHFAGGHKPWCFWSLPRHPFAKAFWHYALLSPISPWLKLKFRLKRIFTGHVPDAKRDVPWNQSILPKQWR